MRCSTSLLSAVLVLTAAAAAAAQELQTEWVSSLPAGTSLSGGIGAFAVDATGVSYVTGTTGASSNTDVVTGAFAPDGTLLWSDVWNGPADWHDQARGIALAPDGVVWVTGNTPGPGKYANVLLLKYDAATGALLETVQYSSGPGNSEHGASIAADAAGNVYVGGGTTGDGGDGLMLSFTADGAFRWKRTWDGAAWGPFSQDSIHEVLVDHAGDVLARIYGVAASSHPDYVVVKYAPEDGSTIWETSWGVTGGDASTDMEIDSAGDVYVTGVGIDFIDKYSTIKLRGTDGQLLWQEYDFADYHNVARGLDLDGLGGVYVTGSTDPDGDKSNFNDDFYTVKRDAGTGALLWTHRYGASCVGCLDVPTDVKVDPAGHVFVAGGTSSPPHAGKITFVLDAATGAELDIDVTDAAGSGFLAFDAAYDLFNGAGMKDWDTGQATIAVTKHTTLAADVYQKQMGELVAGAPASIQVANAVPGALQFVAFSVTGTASIPIPPLAAILGLSDPFLLRTGTADGAGSFAFAVPVPATASGVTLWLQSLELGASTAVVKRTIQ